MKCFVINLERSEGRLQSFIDGWNSDWKCEVFRAIDASTFKYPPKLWKHEIGALGLYLTYLSLFCEIIRRNYQEPFVVFEDDAIFLKGWEKEVEDALQEVTCDWWWTVNLGPHIGNPPPTPITPRLGKLHQSWRTHAVVYNPKSLPDLIAHITYKFIPIDQAYNYYMEKGFECFLVTRKFLVGTRPNISTLTNIKWNEFVGYGLGMPSHDSLK